MFFSITDHIASQGDNVLLASVHLSVYQSVSVSRGHGLSGMRALTHSIKKSRQDDCQYVHDEVLYMSLWIFLYILSSDAWLRDHSLITTWRASAN